MSDHGDPGLSYREAGVDIDRGNRLAQRIAGIAARSRRPEVLAGVGGFGALFELPAGRHREPVLVAGADGVGTKLKLAIECGDYDGIGIDLVAMCVNDVVTLGAEPLFFLDYYASARLDEAVAERVIAGIGRGCEIAGAALIGGECAEMPGLYAAGDFDLAGFCVGVVEKSRIIDGARVCPGDAVIGIASSGVHSNGYSLVRRVLERCGERLDREFDGRTLGAALLEPTRIYTAAVRALLAAVEVHALAHVTGGGIVENLPRVLPAGTGASLERARWPQPAVFEWLRERGAIAEAEMLRTFNCGLGMLACVPEGAAQAALAALAAAGERAYAVGRIEAAASGAPEVAIR